MHVKVLGARQGESRHCHFGTLLVDGGLAVDAGSITSGLAFDQQAAIHSILLTHRHYDHIKDLATFGFNRLGRGHATIYCSEDVRTALAATILSPQIWLDFFAVPSLEAPTFSYRAVEVDSPFNVGEYRARAIAVRHSVPTMGYEVTDTSGARLFYTGDSGPGSGAAWAESAADLLITEVTHADADAALAASHGHLSPGLLEGELRSYRDIRGAIPRVAVVHVNPFQETIIAREVAQVAQRLAADIWLPDEGATILV